MPLKEKTVKFQNMFEQQIPQISFQQTGKADNQVAPEKSAYGDGQCQKKDETGNLEQITLYSHGTVKLVNSVFDKAGNEQLKEINAQQGYKTQQQSYSIESYYRRQKHECPAEGLMLYIICLTGGTQKNMSPDYSEQYLISDHKWVSSHSEWRIAVITGLHNGKL
jgi:hypothetical protein